MSEFSRLVALKGKPVRRIILGLVIGTGLLITAFFFMGPFAVHSSAGGTTNGDSKTPNPTQHVSTVSARKLWRDYHSNKVAADNEYEGKRFNVQGQVTNINKDDFDNVYVLLATDRKFEPVHAEIRIDLQPDVARLQFGQMTTVNCEGGGMILGIPVLIECSIQPNASNGQG